MTQERFVHVFFFTFLVKGIDFVISIVEILVLCSQDILQGLYYIAEAEAFCMLL